MLQEKGAREPGVASGGSSWVPSPVASFKTNKGEDAHGSKPEMRKSVVIKEKFREGDRESARQRKAGRGIQCRVRSNKRI